MKRNLLFLLCILSMLFLISCANDGSNISDDNLMEDDNQFMYLDQVTYIELDDVIKNSYLESIYVDLDNEDIDSFKKIGSNMEKSETQPVAKPFYSLTFYDEKMNVIDVWEVCDAYTVKTSNHIIISRQGELSEWLDMIENKYNITFEIFNRTPGKDYMKQLEQADSAYITEITDNNYISGVSCVLGENDLLSFKQLEDDIQMVQDRRDINDYYYQITFYDNNGGQLYTFIVDFDGKIYTSTGFEVTSQAAIEWFRRVERNYKLDKTGQDEATQDSGVTDSEEKEEMEEGIAEMMDEEKEFLCSIYSGEKRIRRGELFSYQEETLEQYRFAKEYLNEKYPGYNFDFFCFLPANSMNGPVTRVDFMGENKETEYGASSMIIEGEDGSYSATDDFYRYLLRPGYDEALTEKLHSAGIEECITYTRFFGLLGPEVDGTMTVEELFAHGTDMGMKRDTWIFIDMEGGENQETEKLKEQIETVLRDVNQYGAHTIYFIPGILDECSSSEECGNYFNGHKRSDYYHFQFNTFDLND